MRADFAVGVLPFFGFALAVRQYDVTRPRECGGGKSLLKLISGSKIEDETVRNPVTRHN